MIGDPQRDRELAMAEQDIAAASIELFGVAWEIVHNDVGRIERREVLEKKCNISFGVEVANAAVEHVSLNVDSAQQSFEPCCDRVGFRHAPSERDRAAEE